MTDHDPAHAAVPRRTFLGASLATLGVAGCASPSADSAESTSLVSAGDVVLFQGDSITDAGRTRDTASQPNVQSALGRGYAWLAASGLLVQRGGDCTVFNRGISGHKVFQLQKRWERDCLALKPNLVSILIGVNDIWHTKNGKYDGTIEIYERDYLALLEETRAKLPGVRLVVCEPFVLRCGAVDESWFPEFDGYRAAARRVADAHGATWVGFQAMFDEAIRYAPAEHWAKDGVHPSPAGAALMAQTWLRAVVG